MTNLKQQPPRWIKRFFEWYCSPEIAEDLLGDMDELYYQNVQKKSVGIANWKYFLQSLTLVFSYAVRRRRRNHHKIPTAYHSFAMYRSYSKIAFRSLAKQKVFAFINVVCLSVGMSIGLIALAAWVDILEVDNFHPDRERIYRITTVVDDFSNTRTYASSNGPLAERLRAEGTGIEEVVAINRNFVSEFVTGPGASIPFEQGYFVTPNFLKVFNFPLLSGDKATALSKPFSVLISQETAEKLYRDGQALGKMIEVKGMGVFEITGVVANHPRSHFFFHALTSLETLRILEQQRNIEATSSSVNPVTRFYTYLRLSEGSDGKSLRPILDDVARQVEKASTAKKVAVNYELQKLSAIPMAETYNDIGLSWGYVSMLIFFFLSALVLLPACFNYANISVARALKRAKEIGLRKVSGGESKHIFFQMVIETIIISIIALGGAMLLFYLVRDAFLDMVVNGSRTFSLELSPVTFLVFLGFAILTGIIAGVLPASYFAKLNPIQTLRNSTASGKLSKVSIRKGLIVAQFALSLIFILGVSIVVKQYRYALNFDYGFHKENTLNVQLKNVSEKIFKAEIGKLSDVQSVSMSSFVFGNWESSSEYMTLPNGVDSVEVFEMFVDEAYIENFGISLLAGQSFPEERSNQEHHIIVNERFLEKMALGTPHEALGKSFIFGNKSLTVIGVVRNFNFLPLHDEIKPFAFRCNPDYFKFASVRLRSNDISETLNTLQHSWNKLTDQKFEATFLEDELEDSLVNYRSLVRIFGSLGVIAVTISCLGLLAVVISSAESRTREMGIRKVFGAGVGSLIVTMGSGFLKLIFIAIIIATPLTYFMFDSVFLKLYVYRASIGVTELAAGIGLLLVLVAVIIGSQTFRVARINPVETLKYE